MTGRGPHRESQERLVTTSRWSAALACAYPTPDHAGLLRADLAWAQDRLSHGYYDDVPGKPDEVRAYIAEALEHLAHLERMRRRAA